MNRNLKERLAERVRVEQLGIVREITGKQRGRIFVYDAYLKIMERGTEPFLR